MENNLKSLHIHPLGEHWEVESDAATPGQAENRSEAIELAKELAARTEISKIAVHTSDGSVETGFSLEDSD